MRKSCRLPGPLAFTGVRLMEITSRILKNKKRNRLEQGFSNFKMPTSYLGIFLKCKFWSTRAEVESIILHFYQTPGWFLLMLWKLLCKWKGLGYFSLFCLFLGLCILALAASTPLWQWFSTLGIYQNNLWGFWKPNILATSQIHEITISGGETQVSVILKTPICKRQKYRSMGQNRNPRDKSTHLWTPIFDKGGKSI